MPFLWPDLSIREEPPPVGEALAYAPRSETPAERSVVPSVEDTMRELAESDAEAQQAAAAPVPQTATFGGGQVPPQAGH